MPKFWGIGQDLIFDTKQCPIHSSYSTSNWQKN